MVHAKKKKKEIYRSARRCSRLKRRVDTILITNCPRMFYENVIRLQLSNIALQVQRPIERDFMAEKYTQ